MYSCAPVGSTSEHRRSEKMYLVIWYILAVSTSGSAQRYGYKYSTIEALNSRNIKKAMVSKNILRTIALSANFFVF